MRLLPAARWPAGRSRGRWAREQAPARRPARPVRPAAAPRTGFPRSRRGAGAGVSSSGPTSISGAPNAVARAAANGVAPCGACWRCSRRRSRPMPMPMPMPRAGRRAGERVQRKPPVTPRLRHRVEQHQPGPRAGPSGRVQQGFRQKALGERVGVPLDAGGHWQQERPVIEADRIAAHIGNGACPRGLGGPLGDRRSHLPVGQVVPLGDLKAGTLQCRRDDVGRGTTGRQRRECRIAGVADHQRDARPIRSGSRIGGGSGGHPHGEPGHQDTRRQSS